MKTKFYMIAAIALILMGIGACESKPEPELNSDGILPSSIEDVVDIFELKYGEIKEWKYNNHVFKFSVTDIEDNTLPCGLMYFGGNPESYDGVRIHACINVWTNDGITGLKVSSSPCSGCYYRDDGTDIQDIWNMFESWQSSLAQQEGFPYFKQEFAKFGNGALIKNTSLSIYLGKWSPSYSGGWDFKYKEDKSLYKFIFIITKNNG